MVGCHCRDGLFGASGFLRRCQQFCRPSRPFGVALPSFPISELSRTRSLFHQYGSEIGSALLLAALPQAYATSRESRVLAATGHLQNDRPGTSPGGYERRLSSSRLCSAPAASLRKETRATAPSRTLGIQGRPTRTGFPICHGPRLLHQTIRTILTEHTAKKRSKPCLGRRTCHRLSALEPRGPTGDPTSFLHHRIRGAREIRIVVEQGRPNCVPDDLEHDRTPARDRSWDPGHCPNSRNGPSWTLNRSRELVGCSNFSEFDNGRRYRPCCRTQFRRFWVPLDDVWNSLGPVDD